MEGDRFDGRGGHTGEDSNSRHNLMLLKRMQQSWERRKKYILSQLKNKSDAGKRDASINSYVDRYVRA